MKLDITPIPTVGIRKYDLKNALYLPMNVAFFMVLLGIATIDGSALGLYFLTIGSLMLLWANDRYKQEMRVSTVCVVCNEKCEKIVPNKRIYCCMHVPTELIMSYRMIWIDDACLERMRLWYFESQNLNENVEKKWNKYPMTEDPFEQYYETPIRYWQELPKGIPDIWAELKGETKMDCGVCGEHNEEGSLFCIGCGTKLEFETTPVTKRKINTRYPNETPFSDEWYMR